MILKRILGPLLLYALFFAASFSASFAGLIWLTGVPWASPLAEGHRMLAVLSFMTAGVCHGPVLACASARRIGLRPAAAVGGPSVVPGMVESRHFERKEPGASAWQVLTGYGDRAAAQSLFRSTRCSTGFIMP